MNFLQGVQRLCRECDVTAPGTVVGATGESQRMADWYNSAWADIQGIRQDWGWMRVSTSFATVAGQATYTTAQAGTSNFGEWMKQSFRIYPTATGNSAENQLFFINYQDWLDVYQFGAARTATGKPLNYTITPDKSIGLGAVPDAGYTVTADYYSCPTEMSADADTPALPTHYHMIIVYRAMMMYGSFNAAIEVYQRGETEYRKLLRRLTRDRLPPTIFSGALA